MLGCYGNEPPHNIQYSCKNIQTPSKIIIMPVSKSPVSVYDEMVTRNSEEEFPSNSTRSQSIPITEGLYRTASEIQLCLDEEVAEQRDFAFYARLMNGISLSHSKGSNWVLQRENQDCLLHIMQTRNNEEHRYTNDSNNCNNQPKEIILKNITTEAITITKSDDADEEGIFELDL